MILAAAVYVPVQPAPQVPPPVKLNVPALAFTVPVLLNAMLILSLVPPVICNVPALLSEEPPPGKELRPRRTPQLQNKKFQGAPATAVTTAPLDPHRLQPH